MRQMKEMVRASFAAGASRSVGVLIRLDRGSLRAVLFVMRGQSAWVKSARLEGRSTYKSHLHVQTKCPQTFTHGLAGKSTRSSLSAPRSSDTRSSSTRGISNVIRPGRRRRLQRSSSKSAKRSTSTELIERSRSSSAAADRSKVGSFVVPARRG